MSRDSDPQDHGALRDLQVEVDDELLDAIDRAEDQIERGEVHDWATVRERVRREFLDAQP